MNNIIDKAKHFSNNLKPVFSSSEDGVLVSGAESTEVIQREVYDGHTSEVLGSEKIVKLQICGVYGTFLSESMPGKFDNQIDIIYASC